MIKLLIYALLLWGLVKLWRLFNPSSPAQSRTTSPPGASGRIDGGELVQDPHCGVYIPREGAVRGRDGTHFCSESCRFAHEQKGS